MVLVIGIAALYTSVMVVLSRNPVSSVIYLVGTIINGGLIFVVLGINIIPLIYVIVVRHLTILVVGTKVLTIEVTWFKSTCLSWDERNKGVEHARKVLSGLNYTSLVSEIYVYGQMGCVLHDTYMRSKVVDRIFSQIISKKLWDIITSRETIWFTEPNTGPKYINNANIGTWDSLRVGTPTAYQKDAAVPQERKSLSVKTGERSLNSISENLKVRQVDFNIGGTIGEYRRIKPIEGSCLTVHGSRIGIRSYTTGENKEILSSSPLKDVEIYKRAYISIKNNEGSMTPGKDGETLDGISVEYLSRIAEDVKTGRYKCKPVKRVYIPKGNGKMRPLGIPSIRDRIVQAAVKLVIEERVEGVLSENSYGFRPNKSCHTALKRIQKMTGITWMIEGDIRGYFDNIDHEILGRLMDRYIRPGQLIKDLYWKFVKAGYVEIDGKKIHSLTGVPQGGILSPLLSNIYLAPFDEYMEEISKEWNKMPISEPNKEYQKIKQRVIYWRAKLKEMRNQREVLKRIHEREVKMRTMSSINRVGRKLHYVRYADDWIIGVTGTRQDAKDIKEKAKEFLKERLALEISEEKTKITHLTTEYADFLGYKIHVNSRKVQDHTRRRNSANQRKSFGKPKLLVPVDRIKKKLIEKGLADKNGRPKYVGKFIFMSIPEIIERYNAILRGIMYYYNIAEDRWKLVQIVYIIHYSLLHTIAGKLRLTLRKVVRRYGKYPRIKNEQRTKEIKFDKPISFSAPYLEKKYPIKKFKDYKDPFGKIA